MIDKDVYLNSKNIKYIKVFYKKPTKKYVYQETSIKNCFFSEKKYEEGFYPYYNSEVKVTQNDVGKKYILDEKNKIAYKKPHIKIFFKSKKSVTKYYDTDEEMNLILKNSSITNLIKI